MRQRINPAYFLVTSPVSFHLSQFEGAILDEIGNHLRRPSAYICDEESLPAVINFVTIDQAKRNLRIDIQLKQVSLYGLLASLAKKYGLTITYDDNAITVIDPKAR